MSHFLPIATLKECRKSKETKKMDGKAADNTNSTHKEMWGNVYFRPVRDY